MVVDSASVALSNVVYRLYFSNERPAFIQIAGGERFAETIDVSTVEMTRAAGSGLDLKA